MEKKILIAVFFFTLAQASFNRVVGQSLFGDPKKVLYKTISEQWELDEKDKRGTFRLNSYKPFYVTAGRRSNNPNTLPQSENPAYSATIPKPYNNYEARFNLSFKSKLLQSFLFGKGDLWMAYSQVAHWQIYNTELSRAFRELNYEPELIANFPLNFKFLGFDAKMAGVGFNHQSNGGDIPTSRSWNRVIFRFAMERDKLQIYLRPWIRLKDEEDENPLITDYIGRGEATVVYTVKKHSFYLVASNSLKTKNNRGNVQLNYVYPIWGNLRAQMQFFNGYGETLIDYNHKQTTFGLGISFIEW